MATIPERLTAVERDLLAHEKANKQALEAHAKENAMAVQAIEGRVIGVEQRMDSFGPVLDGIDAHLTILVGDKTKRDAIAEAEARKKPETPWDTFKVKLIEGLATLVSGGLIAGAFWVAIQMTKAQP